MCISEGRRPQAHRLLDVWQHPRQRRQIDVWTTLPSTTVSTERIFLI